MTTGTGGNQVFYCWPREAVDEGRMVFLPESLWQKFATQGMCCSDVG